MRTVEEIVKSSFHEDVSVKILSDVIPDFEELINMSQEVFTEEEIKGLAIIIFQRNDRFDFTMPLKDICKFDTVIDDAVQSLDIVKLDISNASYSLNLMGALKILTFQKMSTRN